MSSSRSGRAQDGFTVVEMLMAAFILVVGLLGLITLIDTAHSTTLKTRAREAANNLSRNLVEGARQVPYAQLTSNSVQTRLQAQPGLADDQVGNSGWQINRRGFTYTVAASVCSLDDPRDGVGSHGVANFCKGGATARNTAGDCTGAITAGGSASGGGTVAGNSVWTDADLCVAVDGTVVWSACDLLNTTLATQASGSISALLTGLLSTEATATASATACQSGSATAADTNPEDYKRVVIDVRWGNQRVQQTTLLPNPGASAGPTVTDIRPTSPTTTTITSNTSPVAFAVTTSVAPNAVSWSVDGQVQGNATGSGTSWSFSWPISGLDDGAYLVSAQAFDAYGTAGQSRTATITLNRNAPRAPSGFAAGRNGSAVDFEWRSNSERDIVGYRVYRIPTTGADVLVCALTTATACQDTSPPSSSSINYYVVAVDRDSSGNLREGAHSATKTVTSTNRPPNPPTGLTASTSNGTTILRWSAPLIPDPDLLDGIDFYRIYRDGTAYGNRYDRTGLGSDLTYTDTSTGGTTHSYWVVSVDKNLAESTKVGPVTR